MTRTDHDPRTLLAHPVAVDVGAASQVRPAGLRPAGGGGRHGRLGRLCFAVVGPVHRRLVPQLVRGRREPVPDVALVP